MTRTPVTDFPDQFIEQINFREITQLQIVGKGAFGVVYRGKWRDRFVALKKIESNAERKAFNVEKRQLSRVNHPNIVKLYGSCEDPVCLVMEYAEGGSLYNVLHGSPQVPYTLAHAMSWVHQTACGVAYLHGMPGKPLIHRDLKPPNLLLVNGGTVLKICDFGTACDKQTYMTNSKGSAAWMAPEVFESNAYTEKCDVFSWGIILWEVLTRRKPFDDIGGPAFRIMWHVHKGNRPPQVAGCPAAIERLMNACWDHDPSNRPSMEKIVEVTGRICELLPGANIPLQHSSTLSSSASIPADATQSDSLEEGLDSITHDDDAHLDRGHPAVNHFANTNSGNESHRTTESAFQTIGKSLPSTLPPGQPLAPLFLDVEKNAWKDAVIEDVNEDLLLPQSPPVPAPRRNSHSVSSTSQNPSQPSLSGEKPQPPPRPKPTTLNWNQSGPATQGSVTGPATVSHLPVPSQGHRRTLSDGSEKLFNPGSSKASAAPGSFTHRESQEGAGDSLYDNAYLMLEPEFQPISPATDIPESMRIFEEHKKLAKDYLQTRTEVECLLQAKRDLERQLREQERYGAGGQKDSQRILKEWRELKSENEALQQYHRNLKKQLEIIKSRKQPNTSGTQDFEPEPGWVMVSRRDGQGPSQPQPQQRDG